MTRNFKVVILFLSLLTIWIFAAPLLAERLIVEKTLPRADAILVLSGSSVYIERTRKAAELYKSGVSGKILLTDDGGRGGWSQTEQRNPPFVELAKSELIRQGVLADNIEILGEQVGGTMDEALVLQKEVGEHQWKSVLLVTSAYHSRRVLQTFEKVFGENRLSTEIGIAPAPTGEQTPPPDLWWLSPFGWQVVAGEYVKSLAYWVFY